jgi:hypothetical protein
MYDRAPFKTISLILSVVLLASTFPVNGQNPSSKPGSVPGTVKRPPAGSAASTKGRSGGTTGGDGGNNTGNGGQSSSGGDHTGAIVGGSIGAAAAGIALYELLHHAHSEGTGAKVERIGLTLQYPEDWKLNPKLNLKDDPINVNNFNSAYLQGGIIPPGGADIDIAYFAGVNQPVGDVIKRELEDADKMEVDRHAFRIDGHDGTRVFYTDVYASGFAYENIAIYLTQGDGLYKFFLTYHQGDPHAKGFHDDFDQILKSVRFQR